MNGSIRDALRWSGVMLLKQNTLKIRRTMDPTISNRAESAVSPSGVARRPDGRLELWVCTRCGYTYDGNAGEPLARTAPGTPFEALPASWRCPHCTAEKEYFFH